MTESAVTLWLQVLIFLGVVVNIGYAAIKRKWEAQDLTRAAQEVKRVAEEEAEKVKEALLVHNTQLQAEVKLLAVETRHREEMARQREDTAAAQRAMLVLELSKNTALTRDVGQDARHAYKEANSVNLKIAEVRQEAVSERQHDQQTAAHIKATTDNMHDMAQQFIVQQGPGGERGMPGEPEPEPGKDAKQP
ncbi:MAG TPA: hypothetical protein VNM48_03815 [Chloroflexota bacterium]|nr:hypothetical protein [Chloroflexota bacterium]